MRLAEWESHLLADALVDAEPGRPLYLYVDRELLSQLAGIADGQSAVDDFTTAFAAETPAGRPFGTFVERLRRWRVQGGLGPPPIIAALAMTVLAVTEEPIGASHGVYRRMNALLRRDAVAEPPPGYMEDVPLLWQAWNDWLISTKVAEPTARTHPHWTYQGWARSQGFLRRAERELIHDWFDDARLCRTDDIAKNRLRAEFLSWLQFRGAAGARLLAKISDEASEAILADVLLQELSLWDGPVRQTRGGTSVRGFVAYDEWTNVWSLSLHVPDQLAGRRIEVFDEHYTLDPGDVLSIPVKCPPESLLHEGAVVHLCSDVSVRGGGQPAYLLAESVDTDGWVETRTPALRTPYRVLVRADRVLEARCAVAAAGADGFSELPVPGVDGWVWLNGVTMTAVTGDIGHLRLGSLIPRTPLRLQALGGLRVARDTYLDVGLPDIAVPPDADVALLVDGVPTPVPDDGVVTSLDELALEPGRHVIRHGPAALALDIVSFMNEAPVASGFGHPIESCGGARTFGTTDHVDGGPALRGALLDGVAVAPLMRHRAPRNAETLVLTEEGGLFQVRDDVPPWIEDTDLPISCVDVARVIRGVPGAPAFLLVRTAGKFSAREIPRDLAPATGRLQVAARPDLVGDVATREWVVEGTCDSRRRALALSAAFRHATGGPERLREAAHNAPKSPVLSNDRRDGVHDDMLRWISERRSGTVASSEFRATWGWLAARRGRYDIADRWRFALYQLETLGHVEVDARRGRIAVTPAVAVLLSDAAGFALLCGARPERLLERLCGDGEREIAEARQHWYVHMRVQSDGQHRAIGPTAIYIEWDPRRDDVVHAALATLGVSVTSRTGDRLLEMMPTISQELQQAPMLTFPPSNDVARRQPVPDGEWNRVGSDTQGGLYRYLTAQGPRFAWRESFGEPLRLIDRRLGLYQLARSIAKEREGRSTPLIRDFRTKTLRVPRWLPLPPLVARALVLRTGLTAEAVQLDRPVDGERRFLIYRNVGVDTAEHVGRILAQTIGVAE